MSYIVTLHQRERERDDESQYELQVPFEKKKIKTLVKALAIIN